jgi:hypothetical protein
MHTHQSLPVINRLAVYLMSQLRDTKDSVILPGKEEFASLMGITPRHLNRVLKEMVDLGAINAGYPHVGITNLDVLEDLACGE